MQRITTFGEDLEDPYQIPEVRELMVLTGRTLDNLGLRFEGTEIMGQMELMDVRTKKFVRMMPNNKLPTGGPYVPVNHIPTKYYDYAKRLANEAK